MPSTRIKAAGCLLSLLGEFPQSLALSLILSLNLVPVSVACCSSFNLTHHPMTPNTETGTKNLLGRKLLWVTVCESRSHTLFSCTIKSYLWEMQIYMLLYLHLGCPQMRGHNRGGKCLLYVLAHMTGRWTSYSQLEDTVYCLRLWKLQWNPAWFCWTKSWKC